MSQRREKFGQCSRCQTGKYRTDELGRPHVKMIDGKPVCPDCAVQDIIDTLLNNAAEIRKRRHLETLDVDPDLL